MHLVGHSGISRVLGSPKQYKGVQEWTKGNHVVYKMI